MMASGQALKGGYIIEDVVGHGGSSVVYRARVARGGRAVAIKEMKVPSDSARLWMETLSQVQKEVGMLASLRHRNLAEVLECVSDDEHIFLVMEYIEGRTLDAVVETLPGLVSLATVLPWIQQTAEVLSYLHGRNPPIVFRDLKPSNVMLQAGGRIRLIDFGIARMLQPATETDAFIKFAGTPGFMPPEQGSVTEHTDARSDIYALGATIYTLLLKKIPPTANSRRTGASSLLPASTWHPEVTEEIDHVLARMMALHREQRYETVAEAIQEFTEAARRALAEGDAPAPRQPTPAPADQPAVRFCGRCHAVLEVEAHFCMMCGEKVDDVEPLRSLLPGARPRAEAQEAHHLPTTIGPYRIQRLLASGGMANVYVGEFPASPQAYAIKLLAEISDTDALARFEREILICLKLHHGHICKMVDWGYTDANQPYLVMELLDGESLDVLMHNRIFTWKETAALLRQLLEGLQVIHEAGVIHRDVKPGNVFLTRGGLVKLMDFGVARRSGMRTLTATGVAVGTLIYMAPEQLADARHVDARADLYSVGLIAYAMLAGTHPFEAPNLDRFIVKLVQGEYKPLRVANPDVSEEVAVWVDRLLARQPQDRFASAAAARAAMP